VKPKAFDALCQVFPAFEEEHARRVAEGRVRQSLASVAFVGLARNCDGPLYANLHRVVAEGQRFASWKLHIETNDNTDRTEEVLAAFASEFPEASYRTQTLDRQQFAAEFAGPRTVALAEYRTACQEWVREHAANVDYVAVVDFDAGQQGRHWVHYDAWALRLNSYWDDYTAGHGAWKHHWIPAIGSPPVHVCSAFGGLGIYRREAFLRGRYDGADCEHVTFHKSVADATGQHLFVNPGQRMLMHWLLEASTDGGGNHGDDQR
jgi:hypothetical protein